MEQWIRRGYGAAPGGDQTSNATDAEEVWREIGWSGTGYGFRTVQARQLNRERISQARQQFGSSLEYYRITLNEVHAAVDGDVGLVWGVHTEEFKQKGQSSEEIRVRFTNTLRWDGTKWRNLLFHRDAQPFGSDGQYIRSPK